MAQGETAGASGRWAVSAGYAAFTWGLVFALISFYWGAGGTVALDTIGGTIERLALAHNTAIFVAVWVTGLLKLAGAILALALVRPWGGRLPRRPVSVLAWTAAALLSFYGAVLVAGDALGVARGRRQQTPAAWSSLLWHLWVWDMSFLVWGLLFAAAAWSFSRRSGSGTAPHAQPLIEQGPGSEKPSRPGPLT